MLPPNSSKKGRLPAFDSNQEGLDSKIQGADLKIPGGDREMFIVDSKMPADDQDQFCLDSEYLDSDPENRSSVSSQEEGVRCAARAECS